MKAIILAAGKSTRTYPLTVTKPKPLLRLANKTIIHHNLEQLVGLINEAILIIGYKGEMIKEFLGDRFENIKITYIEQNEQLGTGHALQLAEKFVKGEKFLVLMGDDLYFRADIRRCLVYPLCVLAKRVEDYSNFGVIVTAQNKVKTVVEKPKEFISDLANSAFYVFDDRIWQALKEIKKSPRGEYELTEALKELAEKEDIFYVESTVWFPIGYPWNLLDADQVLRSQEIDRGSNTLIKGDVYDSSIGSNCVIEGTVRDSIIGNNVVIKEGSVVKDSVIGDNVHFSGIINSENKAKVTVNDKIIEVEQFGAAIGDNCQLTNVTIEGGTLVWPNLIKANCTLKGVVKK